MSRKDDSQQVQSSLVPP